MAISESTKKIRAKFRKDLISKANAQSNIRQALKETLMSIPKNADCTILMSSGLDSHACLFAALDAGLRPSITSFTLDTHESTDFKAARHAAEVFGLEFVPVYLKTDLEHLKKWVRHATRKLEFKKKIMIECMWPMTYAIQKSEAKHIISGLAADVFFATSKQMMMHGQDLIAEYRRSYFRRNSDQISYLQKLCFQKDKVLHLPFVDRGRVYAEIQEETDYARNTKPEKALLREVYPDEIGKCLVKKHQNLQLGDSDIAKMFGEKFLASDWNTMDAKAVIAIYNAVGKNKDL